MITASPISFSQISPEAAELAPKASPATVKSVETPAASFVASTALPTKEQFQRLAQGAIKSIEFQVPDKDFKINTILPKALLRAEAKMQVTIDGKEYQAQYCHQKYSWWRGDFSVGSYIVETDISSYQTVDSLLAKGAKVSLAKLQVPVNIVIVEPGAFFNTLNITGGGQGDVSHGRLIGEIIRGQLTKKGVKSSVEVCPTEILEKAEKLHTAMNEVPDIILAPYGTDAVSRKTVSREEYLRLATTVRKLSPPAQARDNILQTFGANGTLVFAAAGNEPLEIAPLITAKDVIGVGALDANGKVSSYSPTNSFVRAYGLGAHKVDLVISNGSLQGFDVDGDGKVDLDANNILQVSQDTKHLWAFKKDLVGKKITDVTYSDREADRLIHLVENGYKFGLNIVADFKRPVLVKGDNKVPLDKVFTKDQFNKLMQADKQGITATGDQNRYFVFDQSVLTLREDRDLLQHLDDLTVDAKGQISHTVQGTSFAPIEPAVKAASSYIFLRDDLSPKQKREAIGVIRE